jgi:type I restriction enzyme S subunit
MEVTKDIAFKKYESYKASGVEWLGEIPEHWEIKPGFTILSESREKNIGFIEKTVLSLSYGNVVIKPEEKLTGLVPESFETYQLVQPGDIIIRPTDLQNDKTSLRTGLAKNNGIITSAYINLRVSKENDNAFYHYYLYTIDINKVIYGLGSGLRQNISFWDFKRFPFPFPPLSEQTKIAQFLDDKTNKIDDAITIKEQQINLLKERKQILIHKAVTLGLDDNVTLKDSGVEWIGEIPEHWVISKIGHFAKVGNGSTPSRDNLEYWTEGTIPWIASGKVNDFIINTPSEYVSENAFRDSSLRLFKKGSVLIGIVGQGKTRGTSALLNIEATINQNVAGIEPSQSLDSIYLHNFLIFSYSEIRNCGKGSNQEALNCELVRSFKMTIPPLEEQKEISEYIESASQKIETAIGLKQQEIVKLKEYKSSLINGVVTGKVRVC